MSKVSARLYHGPLLDENYRFVVTEVPVKTGQLSLYGSKLDGVCLFVHSGTLIVREKNRT